MLEVKSAAPLQAYSVAASADRVIFGDSLGGPLYFIFNNAADAWRHYE